MAASRCVSPFLDTSRPTKSTRFAARGAASSGRKSRVSTPMWCTVTRSAGQPLARRRSAMKSDTAITRAAAAKTRADSVLAGQGLE